MHEWWSTLSNRHVIGRMWILDLRQRIADAQLTRPDVACMGWMTAMVYIVTPTSVHWKK